MRNIILVFICLLLIACGGTKVYDRSVNVTVNTATGECLETNTITAHLSGDTLTVITKYPAWEIRPLRSKAKPAINFDYPYEIKRGKRSKTHYIYSEGLSKNGDTIELQIDYIHLPKESRWKK